MRVAESQAIGKVGCVGLLVEDCFCGPLRSMPAAGSLVRLESFPVRAGGCAANVAIGLARQGMAVDVVGCVGDDGAGTFVRTSLERERVGTAQVRTIHGEATSRTIILLVDGEDRRYFHVEGANRWLSVEAIDRDWLATLDLLYVGGLFALAGIDLAALAQLFAKASRRGITTVLDVVTPRDDGAADLSSLLPYVKLFLPNADEARSLTGLTEPLDQLHALRQMGANDIVVTCGREGAVAMFEDRLLRCGSYAMDVVDPSGSGDAFAAGLIHALLGGKAVEDALAHASAVGASATRAAGTTDSVFSAAEAESFVRSHPMSVHHEA